MPKIIIEIGKGQNADQILASLKAQLGGVSDSVSILGENTRRLEREQRNAERSFRQTAAALDPAIAKSQQYEKSQGALGEALKRNIITQQEHDRLLQLAKDRHADVGGGLATLIGRYGTGATVIAGFTLALSGSLAVLDQVQQFISASISSAAESERIQAQIDARIASTGGAAELTAAQLAEMGNELQNLSKFDDESLAGAQNVLLTFTSISGDTFREALSAVTDMSTALGTDLATNARLVGKALEDPLKGLSAMSRAGVVFTAGQKEVIKTLVESGDLMGAQDLILAALSERFGGAAAADVATFGGSIDRLNNLWDNFMEQVGDGVLPILSSFLTNVGNIIASNGELAETLGVLVTEAGRVAMVFVSAGADGARAFLEMASVIMAGLAGMADGAARIAELLQLDTLADGLREAADGQRQNQEIAQALARASGQVSDAAFLAAINLGKEGAAAKAGAKDSGEHAVADKEAAKEAAAFAKSLRALLDDLDPVGKAEREAAEGIEILNRALAEGMPMGDYQAALGQLIQRLNDARDAESGLTAETKAANSGFAGMLDVLDPAAALVRQYSKDVVALNLVTADEALKMEVLASLTAKLNAELAAIEQPGDAMVEMWREMKTSSTAAQASLDQQIVWTEAYGLALDEGGEALRQYAIDYATAQAKLKDPLLDEGAFRASMGRLIDTEAANQTKEDLRAISEDFAQNMESGLVSAGETFLLELMEGGDDAWEHLGENLTQVLLQSVAEWLMAQLAAIAKAAIAAQAIKGGTGGYGSAADFVGPVQSGAGMSGLGIAGNGAGASASFTSGFAAVAWAAVAVAAVIALAKFAKDKADAKQYGTEVRVDDYGDSNSLGGEVRGRLHQTGGAIAEGIEGLLHAIESAAGVLITDMPGIEVKIRNDKELFSVWVGEQFLGQFKSAQEAMMAAALQAFQQSSFEGQLDPIFASIVENFQGSDPQALIEALMEVRTVMDEVAGLTQIEVDIRDLDNAAAALEERMFGVGVGFNEAARLADEWKAKQFQSFRDQITGHQQTEAEQRAVFERQRAMFNAKLALEKLDVDSQIAAVDAKLAIVEAGGQLLSNDLIVQVNYLQAKADIYGQSWGLDQANLENMAMANNVSIEILNAMRANLGAARAALEQVAPIGAGEFRPRGAGRGGGGGGGRIDVDTGPTEAEQRIQAFLEFLENARLSGLTNYERRLAEIDRTFAEHRRTLDEMRAASDGSTESLALLAEQEAALAAARADQAAALREEVIDGLGLPLEAVRDRVADIQQQVDAWFASGQDLVDQFERGEIGMDQLMAALEQANQLWAEFGSMAQAELQNLALYFTDAMGDTEESARIRAELAEMEWDFKRAELRMLAEAYHAAGMLNDEEYERWSEFIDNLPDNRPPAPEQEDPDQNGNHDNGQDEALEAQRDLIAALEDLADLQRDLWASNLSPLNQEQQTEFLRGQIEDAYNQAQASGSAEDVRAFEALVRDYLSSYQDSYGSTGGYTEEFLRINALINSLLGMGGIGGIVPGPGTMGGTAGTGSTGWRPTPGASGTVLPFERSGGPSSPLVVESPALNALADLTRESNRRLEALERRLAMLYNVTERGNLEAASRAFLSRGNDGMVGISGTPRISRRGA